MPTEQLYYVTADKHPDNLEVGQVVNPGKNAHKLVALRIIKAVPKAGGLYSCEECPARFVSSDTLLKHTSKHHPPKPVVKPTVAPATTPKKETSK